MNEQVFSRGRRRSQLGDVISGLKERVRRHLYAMPELKVVAQETASGTFEIWTLFAVIPGIEKGMRKTALAFSPIQVMKKNIPIRHCRVTNLRQIEIRREARVGTSTLVGSKRGVVTEQRINPFEIWVRIQIEDRIKQRVRKAPLCFPMLQIVDQGRVTTAREAIAPLDIEAGLK
jgi:hypothetical protein